MPYAREAFSTLGDVFLKDGRAITASDVRDATILAIRSTTKADRALLEGSPVRFVGTATIGTDHLDTAWFHSAGIKWCYAPGCNANSVAEYITAALLCIANRHCFTLEGKTIGIVGVGNVGKLVAGKAAALGMRALLNDPPRERSEQSAAGESFVSLDRLLAESDIVTLHVPLTKEGTDKTYHMADKTFFAKVKRGCIFINAARGALVVTNDLLAALDSGIVSHAMIDTWEGEPAYRRDLLERADIGTPHIAGHSFEGKVMGTVMVYRAACSFLGVEPSWSPERLLPAPSVPEIEKDINDTKDEKALWEIVRRIYDIEADDRRLREGCLADDKARAAHFDLLRKNYPERREFRFTRVKLTHASKQIIAKLAALGFQLPA